LKPENLLLTSDYDPCTGRKTSTRILVSDFGQSGIKGNREQRTGATGTLSYCAPEILLPLLSTPPSVPLVTPSSSPLPSPLSSPDHKSGRSSSMSFMEPTERGKFHMSPSLASLSLSAALLSTSTLPSSQSAPSIPVVTAASSSSTNSGTGAPASTDDVPLPNVVIDEKMDLWSLGIVLYAMAFSQLPFQSTNAGIPLS
jgi:hypothetical protein